MRLRNQLLAAATAAACLTPLIGCDRDRDMERDQRDTRMRDDTDYRARGDASRTDDAGGMNDGRGALPVCRQPIK